MSRVRRYAARPKFIRVLPGLPKVSDRQGRGAICTIVQHSMSRRTTTRFGGAARDILQVVVVTGYWSKGVARANP